MDDIAFFLFADIPKQIIECMDSRLASNDLFESANYPPFFEV